MSDLVGNLDCWFSHAKAQMYFFLYNIGACHQNNLFSIEMNGKLNTFYDYMN